MPGHAVDNFVRPPASRRICRVPDQLIYRPGIPSSTLGSGGCRIPRSGKGVTMIHVAQPRVPGQIDSKFNAICRRYRRLLMSYARERPSLRRRISYGVAACNM